MQFRYRWIVASLGCAVLLWHGASHGAEGLSTFEPGFQACATPVSAQEEERLRSELRRYEGILAPLQRKLETLADPAASAERQSLEADMRPTQVELLRVMERLECKRLSQLKEAVVRAPGAPKPNFVEMRFSYATDRLRDPKADSAARKDWSRYYTGDTNPDFKDFAFGKVVVTIPTQRRPGDMKVPGTRFVGQPDPARYFLLREIMESNREAIFQELNAPGVEKESTLLLFVHGFNVSFADAALRTAQLAHDLQFPGKVMLYSWPSDGSTSAYWKDEDSSRISTPRFRRLLADLLTSKVTRIFVVAHSMGTRIVIPAVPTLVAQGVDVSKVSELMLAAADFNVIEFKELAADFARLRARGTRLTIYAASNDFALQLSRRIHTFRRLGESDPALNVYTGLDSVDASAAAPMLRAYGHSYVSDSAQVLGDMQDLVLKGFTPKDRGLLPIPQTDDFGWTIPRLQP